MSQYPGYPGGGYPIEYNAGAFVPNPRPTSVTVISIFAIIIGSLWLLCGGAGMVMQVLVVLSGGRNPFMPGAVGGARFVMKPDSVLIVYGMVAGVINLLIAAALLAIGIGGLKLRPLARRAMIRLSVFILCWATLLTIFQIVWIAPRTMAYTRQMQAQLGAPPNAAMMGQMTEVMQIAGVIITWFLWCALPVCALIFWRKPNVVGAFEGASPPASDLPPGAAWPPPPAPSQY